MSDEKIRRFKQINRKVEHEYLASEIIFEELDANLIKMTTAFDEGPSTERIIDRVAYERVLAGYDILRKVQKVDHPEDGIGPPWHHVLDAKTGRFIGLLENNCYEECKA